MSNWQIFNVLHSSQVDPVRLHEWRIANLYAKGEGEGQWVDAYGYLFNLGSVEVCANLSANGRGQLLGFYEPNKESLLAVLYKPHDSIVEVERLL